MSKDTNWMIYGCYGYSGKLIAEEAVNRGMTPLLAGRDPAKTAAVADSLGLPYRVVDLDDTQALRAVLNEVDLVLHCAGPFSATSKPMVEACLATGTHYLDITGEWRVFEHIHSALINQAAKAAGIVLCPGAGFDVIPTDCIARTLAEAMPDATALRLGFSGGGDLAPGTAKTMVEGIAKPTYERRDGEVVKANMTPCVIDYGNGPEQSLPFSWGDISTAYYNTSIPNITVYNPATSAQVWQTRLVGLLRPLLKLESVQRYLKRLVEKKVTGPDPERRVSQRLKIWGEVTNAAGGKARAFAETTGGYQVTIIGPLAIVEHLLTAENLPSGSLTPSQLMGKDFVASLPDCSEITLMRN